MARVKHGMDKTKLRPQEPLYFACEDLDLSWYHWQVRQVIDDYGAGVPVPDMAAKLKRSQEEVAILLMDLALVGRIENRPGGVYGREQNGSSAEISGR